MIERAGTGLPLAGAAQPGGGDAPPLVRAVVALFRVQAAPEAGPPKKKKNNNKPKNKKKGGSSGAGGGGGRRFIPGFSPAGGSFFNAGSVGGGARRYDH